MSKELTIHQDEHGSGFDDAPSDVFEGRNIPDEIHDVCRDCIKKCRDKYSGFIGSDGTYYKDGFAVNCKYIPKDEIFINKKIKNLVSEDDFEEMNSYQSALLWATRNLINPDTGLPWKPRSYQVQPLLCSSPNIVMRYGRRCLPAGVPILMADGTEKPIEKIKVGEEVKSIDVKTLKLTQNKVISFWENGEKDIYRIILKNGKYLDCTSNHPLLASDPAAAGMINGEWFWDYPDWISIEDGLKVGMPAAFVENEVCLFSQVASIKKIDTLQTYDIEIANTHNMISNGIVSHNTGKSVTLAVLMAWYLFTCGGMRDATSGRRLKKINILVVAPLKSHVDELLARLRGLIYAVPKLAACIKRDTKGSPQIIELNGTDGAPGSMIKGYASGDASGSKGTGIRGNDAHLIIVDEAAFVSEAVMKEAIKPILMTTPSTKMIWSSTPSGIAGDHFEEVCLNMPTYKEFYVSSTAMPNFDLMRDAMIKEYGNSPDEWEREVEANFPEGGIGVYKKSLVRVAQKDYSYEDMYPHAGMVYTFGVDWNKEKGTEIYIVGTQKASPFISQVVLGLQIPKKDFDTPMGIGKIIELNRIWKPAYIYVDEGGDGNTCCQMLQFIGKEAAGKNITDARLMYIVKAYDFGSKIKFRDFQGKEVKKHAKAFLVENSVRRFELNELYLSRHDVDLQKQLDNYVVKRRTEAGLPVYGTEKEKIGDHKVDALNLALVAIRLELPSLNSREVVQFESKIRYSQNALSKPGSLVNESLSHGVRPRALNHEHGKPKGKEEELPFRIVKPNEMGISRNTTKSRSRGLKYRGGRTWR